MKKLFFSLMLMIAAVSFASAQGGERRGGGGPGRQGNAQMREMLREQMKKEMKATDAQADSAIAIQQQFQMKAREVRMNQSLSDDDKKAKVTELEAERNTKMKAVLNEEQLKKLDEIFENMRRNRQQRQGGQK